MWLCMKKPIQKLLLLVAGGLANACFANVSLYNFQHSSSDALSSNSAPKETKLQRTYQSRSLFRGYLGVGWCTVFDNSLTPTHVDKLLFHDCMFDRPFRFSLSTATENLWIYTSLDNPSLKLRRLRDQFQLRTKNQTYIFDLEGRIIKYISSTEQMAFQYGTDAKLKSLTIFDQEFLITLNSTNRISTIFNKNSNQKLNFKYKDANLVLVDSGAFSKSYLYDKYHNLIQIDEPTIKKKIAYDVAKDRTKSVEDHNGCYQTREFLGQKINVRLGCNQNSPTLIQYDHLGRLTELSRRDIGQAKFYYDSNSRLQTISYTNTNTIERRYTLNEIPALARGDLELDTLIRLATDTAQAL